MLLLVVVVMLAPWVLGGSVVTLVYASFSRSVVRGYRIAVATTLAVLLLMLLSVPFWLWQLSGRFPDGSPAGWAESERTGDWEPFLLVVEEGVALAASLGVAIWKGRSLHRPRHSWEE